MILIVCEVCNRQFTSKIGLHSHICRFKDNKHYLWWLKYLNDLIDNPDIKVLAYKKENGEKLIQIHNSLCKHTVWINYYSIIRQHQLCNHKDCVSKKKSKVLSSIKDTKQYRSNLSKAVKQALKDPIKRMNRLEGQAMHQRKLNSPYELMFIGLLTKYNINYTYQVPMIIKDEGCIIDFYLDDYDLYVNINCDIFHWMPDEKAKPELRKSIQMRKQKDELIRSIFKESNIQLYELYTFEDMENFIISIMKGE